MRSPITDRQGSVYKIVERLPPVAQMRRKMQVYADDKAHSDNTDAGEALVEIVYNWCYIRNYCGGSVLAVRTDPAGYIGGQDDMQLYVVDENDLRCYYRRSEGVARDSLHQ